MSSSTTTTSPGIHSCEHCKQPATLKCGACPDTDPTRYCSKACQKADWKKQGKHHALCTFKQLYAYLRTMAWPLDSSTLSIIDEWPNIVNFLRDVPVDARPIKFGGDDNLAGIQTTECIKGMNKVRKTTKAAHVSRVATLKEKYGYTPPHLVPITDRPWQHGLEDGRPVEGIQHYPQDYKQVSFRMYEFYWCEGNSCLFNPFVLGIIPLNELREPLSEEQVEEAMDMEPETSGAGWVVWIPH